LGSWCGDGITTGCGVRLFLEVRYSAPFRPAPSALQPTVHLIPGLWWGKETGDHCGDLGVDGWIKIEWISRRWDVGIWTGLGWPRI